MAVRRRWLSALTLGWALAMPCGAARAAAAAPGPAAICGPFGDAPAQLIANVVPQCVGGVRIGPWKDSASNDRYACLYEPPLAASGKPLPLVVYLHPSLARAGSVSQMTNLLDFLKTANVSDDPARPGFILLAPAGRDTTHHYPPPDHKGTGWDIWYRQMSAAGAVKIGATVYPENVDAATIDHFIAAAIATRKVDPRRVYLTGWSNGGSFAYLYGLNRPAIAAVGVYSSPDPFQLGYDPCPQVPVSGAPANDRQLQIFNPGVPTYQVHNSCDIAGTCPNVQFFVGQLAGMGADASATIIDRDERGTASCTALCGTDPNGGTRHPLLAMIGVARHIRWPKPWTAAILDFFRRHPLKAPPG
ncbi:MAG: hypothetical protein IVW56_12005 [Candidatus Binataceae bacterium]|nr:hypothetical protein [Candidatus Binataceae bacterium]